MKKLFLVVLMPAILIISSLGLSACTKDTNNFDNIPIDIKSSWVSNTWNSNTGGYVCLSFKITNNSRKTIRDIQGLFYYTTYDADGNLLGYNETYYVANSLYLWDAKGNDISLAPKTKIRPGETLTLIVDKIPPAFLAYMYEVHIYITWIDFVFADNWGYKNMTSAPESVTASIAPMVDIEPLYRDNLYSLDF